MFFSLKRFINVILFMNNHTQLFMLKEDEKIMMLWILIKSTQQ